MEDNIKQSEADKGLARSYAWPNKFRREIGFDVSEQLKARSIEFKKEENLSRQGLAMKQRINCIMFLVSKQLILVCFFVT